MRRVTAFVILCGWAVAAWGQTPAPPSRGGAALTAAGDAKAVYKQKAAAVTPKDAEGHYQLALWCEKNGLKDEMKTELQRALTADPKHEGANLKLGKVLFKGTWVQPEDVKRFESHEFSRYEDPDKSFTTHAAADLERQIRQLEMLNQLKPTHEQLEKMWAILNAAEAERLALRAKAEKDVEEIEAAWTALRNEALKGVVDSFDQDTQVEHRAKEANAKRKQEPGKVWEKLYGDFGEPFLDVLTPEQRDDLLARHGAKGGRKRGAGKEIRGTQAGVDFLEKVRALTENDFNAKKEDLAAEALKKFGKGPQTLLGKQEQNTGKRSAEDVEAEKTTVVEILERVRIDNDMEWQRKKFGYAAEIEAKNQEERLKTIMAVTQKKNSPRPKKERPPDLAGKLGPTLFDGSLREVVGLKLGMTADQMVVRSSDALVRSATPAPAGPK